MITIPAGVAEELEVLSSYNYRSSTRDVTPVLDGKQPLHVRSGWRRFNPGAVHDRRLSGVALEALQTNRWGSRTAQSSRTRCLGPRAHVTGVSRVHGISSVLESSSTVMTGLQYSNQLPEGETSKAPPTNGVVRMTSVWRSSRVTAVGGVPSLSPGTKAGASVLVRVPVSSPELLRRKAIATRVASASSYTLPLPPLAAQLL